MKHNLIIILLIFLLVGCSENPTPKPRGFFRISFPVKTYAKIGESAFPYSFEKPDYAEIRKLDDNNNGPFDINLTIPENKADIHITYKDISSNNKQKLEYLIEDARKLAYKHTVKADAIDEEIFINPEEKVYGTLYIIKGNAASPFQFYLTDSVKHFLRGSFYIREIPNVDSLRPVIDFIKPDIMRIIETATWN